MDAIAIPIGICDLPDEVLLKIFSYMSAKTMLSCIPDVCHRWRMIVESDSKFWRSLKCIVSCNSFINIAYLDPYAIWEPMGLGEGLVDICDFEIRIGQKDLIKLGPARCIRIEGDCKTTDRPALFAIRVLDIISRDCLLIEKIEFYQCFGATSCMVLRFLNDRYKLLKEVTFGVNAVYRIPYEEFMNFENLQVLISHDYKFMRSDLSLIANHCTQLNSLWVLFSRSLRNDDIIYFLEKKKVSLRELGIGSSISDNILKTVQECSNLNVLFISDARYISENGLKYINDLPKLKYLSLHKIKLHTEVLLNWACTSTVPSQLKILDITDFYWQDPNFFNMISQKCPVTFKNDVNKAVKAVYRPWLKRTTGIHWMYCNAL